MIAWGNLRSAVENSLIARRGVQSDYAGIVALGAKTVISLRQRPDERVRQSAELAGMRYINLPMNVRGYPPEDLAPCSLDLVNNPANSITIASSSKRRLSQTGEIGYPPEKRNKPAGSTASQKEK